MSGYELTVERVEEFTPSYLPIGSRLEEMVTAGCGTFTRVRVEFAAPRGTFRVGDVVVVDVEHRTEAPR